MSYLCNVNASRSCDGYVLDLQPGFGGVDVGSCPATEVVAHPITSLVPDVVGQIPQCSMPSQRSYTAHQVSTGAFLRDIMDHDVNSPHALHHLTKYYINCYLDTITWDASGCLFCEIPRCLFKYYL
jgi:hypothetical protein